MDVERLDCTIDDLLESPGIAFSQSLPHYLLGKALDALALLHDWSDLGIVTLGDFRRAARRSLREIIPASAYFRHFRHVDPQELDRVPFRIVHCDLKPANFLLRITEETRHKMERGSGEIGPADVPELKITDFDLCRYSQPDPGSSGSSQGPSFTGTFGYTAPELFLVSGNTSGSSARDERRIVPLVDFYALGTLLFELLTRMPLVPRDMLDMEDDAYYGRIRTFQDSTEFRSRLSKVENPADRALIAACTEFRQADREAALRRLLGVPAQSGDLVASDLRDYHRRGHGLPGH
jgi:serine/threonine protein kinase